jgi:hypothetical protein
MVVMLLISIILAVAIPRFEGGFLQDPVKQFSRKMISMVRSLRSAAVQTQQQHTLIVDLNAQELYVIRQAMEAETAEAGIAEAGAAEIGAEEARAAEAGAASEPPVKKFKPPDSLALVAVEFPDSDQITIGTAEIHFYPAGYSDHAFIRLESNSEDRYTYVVQPLLPKVKLFEEWIDF